MRFVRKISAVLFFILIIPPLLVVALTFLPGSIEPSEQAGVKLPEPPMASVGVKLHFLRSARAESPEAFAVAGGSLFEMTQIVHGGILVEHFNDTVLFDTGLGRNVDAQFDLDMPSWLKPLMAYEKGLPLADLIANNSALPSPQRIVLSHTHWDHASGIEDFPGVPLLVTQAELDFLARAVPPAILPSQFESAGIDFEPYELQKRPYAGFEYSWDIYGDGTVVLVSLSGHTPGSTGMFVNASDGKRRLFVGDAVWKLASVTELRSKFILSSILVDDDRDATNEIIAKLHALLQANPELKIIPAHDLETWK